MYIFVHGLSYDLNAYIKDIYSVYDNPGLWIHLNLYLWEYAIVYVYIIGKTYKCICVFIYYHTYSVSNILSVWNSSCFIASRMPSDRMHPIVNGNEIMLPLHSN